jgi:hypothetical protein
MVSVHCVCHDSVFWIDKVPFLLGSRSMGVGYRKRTKRMAVLGLGRRNFYLHSVCWVLERSTGAFLYTYSFLLVKEHRRAL